MAEKILDHCFPCPDERMAPGHTAARNLVRKSGIRHFPRHAGVCHQVLIERGLASSRRCGDDDPNSEETT